VGLVHGLAGSAAVALLVVAANPDATWAALYLLVFGAGTVVGMMLLTTILSAPIAYTFERISRMNVWLVRATGVGSVAFGLFLAYQLVAVHGMFSAAPSWTPQ
jgi:cytochrome c biogenesis protein CcdA